MTENGEILQNFGKDNNALPVLPEGGWFIKAFLLFA